jgi:hypothetical protein
MITCQESLSPVKIWTRYLLNSSQMHYWCANVYTIKPNHFMVCPFINVEIELSLTPTFGIFSSFLLRPAVWMTSAHLENEGKQFYWGSILSIEFHLLSLIFNLQLTAFNFIDRKHYTKWQLHSKEKKNGWSLSKNSYHSQLHLTHPCSLFDDHRLCVNLYSFHPDR